MKRGTWAVDMLQWNGTCASNGRHQISIRINRSVCGYYKKKKESKDGLDGCLSSVSLSQSSPLENCWWCDWHCMKIKCSLICGLSNSTTGHGALRVDREKEEEVAPAKEVLVDFVVIGIRTLDVMTLPLHSPDRFCFLQRTIDLNRPSLSLNTTSCTSVQLLSWHRRR